MSLFLKNRHFILEHFTLCTGTLHALYSLHPHGQGTTLHRIWCSLVPACWPSRRVVSSDIFASLSHVYSSKTGHRWSIFCKAVTIIYLILWCGICPGKFLCPNEGTIFEQGSTVWHYVGDGLTCIILYRIHLFLIILLDSGRYIPRPCAVRYSLGTVTQPAVGTVTRNEKITSTYASEIWGISYWGSVKEWRRFAGGRDQYLSSCSLNLNFVSFLTNVGFEATSQQRMQYQRITFCTKRTLARSVLAT